MFVRASSVDEGLYRKILLRVSELDLPVFQPLDLAKRRKLQEITSASKSEHNLDPPLSFHSLLTTGAVEEIVSSD